MRSTDASSLHGAYMLPPMPTRGLRRLGVDVDYQTEPAIACRCGSGEWWEGKTVLRCCKVSVFVCEQAEHEVTLW